MDVARYLGLPWEPMGRGPGYDCWGLARLVLAEQFGWFLPSYQYGDDPSEAIAEGIQHFERVDSPQPGDLALHEKPLHIGVMVGPDRMLHITHGKTACVERVSAIRRRRVAGYFRLRSAGASPSV